MTCIAAVIEGGRIHMGADSAASGGGSLQVRKDSKVFTVGNDIIMGTSGSFRMRDLLKFKLKLREYDPNEYTPQEYMVVEVVEAIRRTFKDGGHTRIVDDNEEHFEDEILVGFQRQIFTIEEDFHVSQQMVPFHATGSGGDIAVGALYALHKTKGLGTKKLTPREQLLFALNAAEQYSAEVRGPFNLLTLYPPKRDKRKS